MTDDKKPDPDVDAALADQQIRNAVKEWLDMLHSPDFINAVKLIDVAIEIAQRVGIPPTPFLLALVARAVTLSTMMGDKESDFEALTNITFRTVTALRDHFEKQVETAKAEFNPADRPELAYLLKNFDSKITH